MSRKRHPRSKDASFLRQLHPYQVEIVDWLTRIAKNKPGYTAYLHNAYHSPASWADHRGSRTFGFDTEEEALRFNRDMKGVLLFTTFDQFVDKWVENAMKQEQDA